MRDDLAKRGAVIRKPVNTKLEMYKKFAQRVKTAACFDDRSVFKDKDGNLYHVGVSVRGKERFNKYIASGYELIGTYTQGFSVERLIEDLSV